MAVVTGKTAAYMDDVVANTIVGGHIDGDDLVLEKQDATEIIVGAVVGIQGDQGPPGSTGVFNNFNRQTSDYTLVLADDGLFIEMDAATPNNLTVPANASVALPVGCVIQGVQRGAGLTTIVADGGVTLNALNGLVSMGQFARFKLEKVDTDEWYVSGDLT